MCYDVNVRMLHEHGRRDTEISANSRGPASGPGLVRRNRFPEVWCSGGIQGEERDRARFEASPFMYKCDL
jgi:hypothetical protein